MMKESRVSANLFFTSYNIIKADETLLDEYIKGQKIKSRSILRLARLNNVIEARTKSVKRVYRFHPLAEESPHARVLRKMVEIRCEVQSLIASKLIEKMMAKECEKNSL